MPFGFAGTNEWTQRDLPKYSTEFTTNSENYYTTSWATATQTKRQSPSSSSGMEHGQQEAQRWRVIKLRSPCMGHLIPLVELARCLVTDHGLTTMHFFTPATPKPSEEYLAVAPGPTC